MKNISVCNASAAKSIEPTTESKLTSISPSYGVFELILELWSSDAAQPASMTGFPARLSRYRLTTLSQTTRGSFSSPHPPLSQLTPATRSQQQDEVLPRAILSLTIVNHNRRPSARILHLIVCRLRRFGSCRLIDVMNSLPPREAAVETHRATVASAAVSVCLQPAVLQLARELVNGGRDRGSQGLDRSRGCFMISLLLTRVRYPRLSMYDGMMCV